jgi:hypothetical protein
MAAIAIWGTHLLRVAGLVLEETSQPIWRTPCTFRRVLIERDGVSAKG